jgi:peroxiredoxin
MAPGLHFIIGKREIEPEATVPDYQRRPNIEQFRGISDIQIKNRKGRKRMKHLMRMKSITCWMEAWEIMWRRLCIRLPIFIAIIALASLQATAQADQIRLPSVDGKAVSLANHRGQVVVLTFNADWTPMTKRSLPALQRIADLYEGRDVVFYWVSVNSARAGEKTYATDAGLKAFAQESGLRMTVLRDSERKAFRAFGLDVIPSIVIIDRTGQVYQTHAGFGAAPAKGYEFVIKTLNQLLK